VGKKSGDKKGCFCRHDGEVDWLQPVLVACLCGGGRAGAEGVDGVVGPFIPASFFLPFTKINDITLTIWAHPLGSLRCHLPVGSLYFKTGCQNLIAFWVFSFSSGFSDEEAVNFSV